jgi:CDP-glycerol glycerophosphotransferase (TagB/SpsB family)
VRECLESLRSQTYPEWEAIVIDDASTDGSMRIVSEVTAGDSRFRITRLDTNSGLGSVRNLGFAQAKGEYVMLLDSDDYFEPDALELVASAINENDRPDIVWFDYARESWVGRKRRNLYGHLLAEVGPGPTTVSESPELLQILPIAPNKAYRRDSAFAERYPFPSGLYEDIPFTYPVILDAESIVIIDKALYIYRQRRHGSLRREQSTAHFDILRQYDLMFQRVGFDSLPDSIRGTLYRKMIDHFFTIYNTTPSRIPLESRTRFFHESAQIARSYATVPDRIPLTGMGRLGLLQADRRIRYALSGLPGSIQDRRSERLKRHKSRTQRSTPPLKTRVKRWLYHNFLLRQPIDSGLVVFQSGAGTHPRGNPEAVYQALCTTRPDLRAVWVLSPKHTGPITDGRPWVESNSWEFYKTLARAAYFVSDANLPYYFVKRRRARFLQTLDGTPLEMLPTDTRRRDASPKRIRPLMEKVDTWDSCISSSTYATEVIKRAFPSDFDVLEFGQPRNDAYFANVSDERISIRRDLGIDDAAQVILYAPVRHSRDPARLPDLNVNEVAVRADTVVLSTVPSGQQPVIDGQGRVIDVSSTDDLHNVAMAADVLVTDYSPLMFDFANLGRPIVIFLDDDHHPSEPGTYFDVVTTAPGTVVTTAADLVSLIESSGYDTDETRQQLEVFRARFCEFEDGSASERTVDHVFGPRGR